MLRRVSGGLVLLYGLTWLSWQVNVAVAHSVDTAGCSRTRSVSASTARRREGGASVVLLPASP